MATKMDEYAPVSRPTNRASAKSRNASAPNSPAPTNSSDATGSTATKEVLMERMSTWFIERFTMFEYESPRTVPRVETFSFTLSKTTTVS